MFCCRSCSSLPCISCPWYTSPTCRTNMKRKDTFIVSVKLLTSMQARPYWFGGQVWTKSSQHSHLSSWFISTGLHIRRQLPGLYCTAPSISVSLINRIGSTVPRRDSREFCIMVGFSWCKCRGILGFHRLHAGTKPVASNRGAGEPCEWYFLFATLPRTDRGRIVVQSQIDCRYDTWFRWMLVIRGCVQISVCEPRAKGHGNQRSWKKGG